MNLKYYSPKYMNFNKIQMNKQALIKGFIVRLIYKLKYF